MEEVKLEYIVANWDTTFCLYDPTDSECPYCCIGADQHGLIYIYGAESGEDMDWQGYTSKSTDRFFVIKEEMKTNVRKMH